MNQNFVKSAVAATLLIAGTIGFSACSSSDEKKSESSAKVENSPMAVPASRLLKWPTALKPTW